jgi:ketosteroid isomerase-like protein
MARWVLAGIVMVAIPVTAACGGREATPTTAEPAVTSPAAPPANLEAVVSQLERDWVAAILAKDAGRVGNLIADDFVGTTDDMRYGKAEAIEDVTSGSHESLEITDLRVRPYGDTVAVVTFEQSEKSRHGEEDFSGQYLFTNVWVNRNGQWRAVASHGNRLR